MLCPADDRHVLSQIVDTNLAMGADSDAKTRTLEALRILRQAGLTRTSTFAIAEGILADVLMVQGNYQEAKNAVEHAISIGAETLRPLAPRFGSLITTLAQISQESEDLGRALRLSRQAADIFKRGGDPTTLELGSAYQNLAVVYALRGEKREAMNALDAALSTWKPILAPNAPVRRSSSEQSI